MSDGTWGAPLVIDWIEEDDYPGGRLIRGHAYAEGIEDEGGRVLLQLGSRVIARGSARIWYLLADHVPDFPQVQYLERGTPEGLAREIMAMLNLSGTVVINWENYSSGKPSGQPLRFDVR